MAIRYPWFFDLPIAARREIGAAGEQFERLDPLPARDFEKKHRCSRRFVDETFKQPEHLDDSDAA